MSARLDEGTLARFWGSSTSRCVRRCRRGPRSRSSRRSSRSSSASRRASSSTSRSPIRAVSETGPERQPVPRRAPPRSRRRRRAEEVSTALADTTGEDHRHRSIQGEREWQPATCHLASTSKKSIADRKPIEAVGTNTVGFLGESTQGPAQRVRPHHELVAVREDVRRLQGLQRAPRARGLRLLQQRRLALLRRQRRRARAARKASQGRAAGDKKDDKAPARRTVGGGGRDGLFIGRDGGPGARTGLKCFDEVDEIAIVAAPGQRLAGGAGRAALALRDAQGSLRDPRLARDDHRRRRQAAQAARLEVRRVLLPVDPGLRPGQGQHLRPAVGSHRRRVLAHR